MWAKNKPDFFKKKKPGFSNKPGFFESGEKPGFFESGEKPGFFESGEKPGFWLTANYRHRHWSCKAAIAIFDFWTKNSEKKEIKKRNSEIGRENRLLVEGRKESNKSLLRQTNQRKNV
ncbi:hypothetical protein AP285_02600 [Limnospira platensis YZ]|nr:hypothetical protein AP285_02600 [Arthrospira platensis YZ]KDR57049.1 hypothetical protein APPUASWS_013015 [Arthrospira platensis str. Paraca]